MSTKEHQTELEERWKDHAEHYWYRRGNQRLWLTDPSQPVISTPVSKIQKDLDALVEFREKTFQIKIPEFQSGYKGQLFYNLSQHVRALQEAIGNCITVIRSEVKDFKETKDAKE